MTTITRKGLLAPEKTRKGRWWLKACPKCSGDLYEENAWGETNIACLLCGRTLTRAEEQKLGIVGGEDDVWGLELPEAKPADEEAA
ncbi:MAG: hypothetical protein HYX92_07895 [Chloroflexi bacterium]|nr:hypothetical protein [Chloroflexota bacterium]